MLCANILYMHDEHVDDVSLHTYIHTYIHSYIATYIHTYIYSSSEFTIIMLLLCSGLAQARPELLL